MRTPPPVLDEPNETDKRYKRTWMDVRGPDGANEAKAIVAAAFVFLVGFALSAGALFKLGISMPGGTPMILFTSASLSAGIAYAGWRATDLAGEVTKKFTLPSGNSTPYEQTFSFQEAMIMKGDIGGALESYEAIISENPTAVSPRIKAAEHYAKNNRNPQRAAELFREIRNIPGVTPRDTLYASSRLTDLYDGVLDDPGRMLVELRRLIEQFPSSPQAKHAREALPRLKARLDTLRQS